MRIAKLALVLALTTFATPVSALAEVWEFTGCTFKEGHTMADVDKWLPKWKAVVDKVKVKEQVSAEVVMPLYDTENALGSGLNEMVDGGAGTAVDAEFNKIATCTASIWMGRKVYGK